MTTLLVQSFFLTMSTGDNYSNLLSTSSLFYSNFWTFLATMIFAALLFQMNYSFISLATSVSKVCMVLLAHLKSVSFFEKMYFYISNSFMTLFFYSSLILYNILWSMLLKTAGGMGFKMTFF